MTSDAASPAFPGEVQPSPLLAAKEGDDRAEPAGKPGGGLGSLRMTLRHAPVMGLLVMVLVVSWLKFLPLIRLVGQEAGGARYDHAYAREFIKKIPNRAIVLTHVPTMFLLWGQNAIQAYAGINNPEIIRELMTRYDGHVYFHQGYWCNTQNDSSRTICNEMQKRYDLERVALVREQTHEYALYKIRGQKQ